MSYSLNFEKMQQIITERNEAKITKKDGNNYLIVGAKPSVVNGCKFYQIDASTKHYNTNDFYKIQAHLKKAGEDGFTQSITKYNYNGREIDCITNSYQVKNLATNQVEDRSYTIYVDSLQAFKKDSEDRLILQTYCKDGYIKKWVSEDSFITANGNKWSIIDGVPVKEDK